MADANNDRIQVFTAKGKFLHMFRRCGQGRELAVGVAIDTSDMVYVSDDAHYRVSMFTSGGLFVMSFAGRGNGPGEFECPYRLAVDDCMCVMQTITVFK